MQYVNHSTAGRARAQKSVLLNNQTETKTTQQNSTEKLSAEIRQTGSHNAAREHAQGFPLHLAVIHVLFHQHLFPCFSFSALIAVYRERVITCETGRVIFLPRV